MAHNHQFALRLYLECHNAVGAVAFVRERMALVLEPRFLFDASVGPATTKPIADHTADTTDHAAPAAAQKSGAETADATSHPADAKAPQPDATAAAAPAADPQAPSQQQGQAAATTASQPSSVLFVDTRVSGWKTLAASVGSDTKVVVIDGSTDGIAQVTKALEGLRNVDRLDFLTYGRPGQIEFGAGTVDAGGLMANAGQIAAWRDHLADNAQIQFWGCDVGAGTTGNSFVSDLHSLTGVAVAASIDATGAAALGGNWTLERTAGDVVPSVPFSTQAVANFMTVLDAPVPTVTLSGLPSEILLGGTFTATVSFDNTAATGIGYGPYIDLFVPNNTLDKVTLNSANLLGHDLAISSVVYSTSVAGHLGVLGALHPLLLDATGAPQFVNAPPTAVEGGRMYVLELPFGSFTPDQSAANVTLNFTIDKTSVVTNQHGGQLMTMGAIGGFAYGADALNNPSVDPGLRGTAGNTPTESTAANGGVSASASVVLVKASAQVVTVPGEGETPTGPDYPAHLQITVTPAPATDGNPITGTVSTITLPDNVQYTGGPITITGAPGATATFVPGSTAQGGSVQVSIPAIEAPGPIVLDIPIFVPETAANGTPVLDPATGNPVPITFDAATYTNGVWMPWAGSADEGLPYDVNGTLQTSASFTARSLAVQVTAFDTTSNSATNFRPGDIVEFTTAFEISDYFNFNGLVMRSLLDDGFTVDPSVAPVLTLTPAAGGPTTTINLGAISGATATVNGQVVATTGSNADWSFVRDNAGTGTTTVDLTPSNAIAAALGTSRLDPGITGKLTVTARVLDKYTNSHIDPFTGVGGSITERDSVHGSVSATATVVTALGLPTTLPPSEITDNSSVDLVIPEGTARIFVAAVNGVVVNSFQPGETYNVQPGDTVTYAINYNLVTGDYRSLTEAAFMPLPIINVADPLANGSTVTAFVEDTGATTASPIPGAGKYFLYNPSPGMSVVSANVNAASNGITFDLGHRDDTTNAAGQRATILFTFRVTTAPFADGLSLTAQGEASLTNASGTGAPIIDLSGVTLNEPNLTQSAKTGIASLVDNGLGAKSATYTAEITGAAGDPSTVYVPAGSSGSPFVATHPEGPLTVGDLQDLNVAGADGSDTVRVIITVANTGASSNGAFDVTVSSSLPAGYTIADVSNITATRGGGLPVTLVPNAGHGTGTMVDLFTANGVMLEDPASSAETPHPTLYGTADIAHRNVLTISYDLKLKPDQAAGMVLTAVGNIVNYTNIFDGVAQGNGFVVNGVPVGGTAADLVNNATVTTTAPTMPKTFGPSDTPQNDNVDPTYPNATVVVGNTRPVTITVTLPEGSLNNGSGHVLVTEQLPADEIFRNLVSIVPGPGVTLTGAGGATVSGSTVTFDLGSQVRNTNAEAPGTVTITYNAYFADGANTDGTTFTSTANLVYSGTPVAPAVVTFVQHDPMLNAALSDDAGGIAFTGKTITYTYTIANNGLVQSQTTESQLDVPTGLAYVPGTLQLVSQSGTPISSGSVDESNGAGGILVVNPGTIAAGGVLTYRFQATVAPDLAAGTNLTIAAPASDSTGLSIALPQPPATARTYHFSASDPLSVRTFTSALYISGEANGTTVVSATAPVTSANVVIGDITRLHGQTLLPEGTNTNVVLDFALPAGLSPFLADGTVKLALISDLGHITSSTLDPTGNTAGLQVAQGTMAVDPTTFTPTYVLPASAIDSTSVPGHLRISLGTVTDNGVSPLPNYAVLEFNGVVTNVFANQAGVVLSPTLVVASDAFTTAASRVNETIVEPNVDMQKVVTAIDSGAGSVDYRVTLTNTGNATAYAVTVTDPLPTNVGSIVGLSSAGGATGLVVTPGGGNVFTATMTLAAGQSQVFTYTMVVADPGAPVPATTVTETFQSLNPTITAAFGSAVGPVGGASGARDGSSLPTVGGLNDYWRQVTNSLGTASGQVWQALGDIVDTFDPVLHTALGGVSVTHTSAGPDGVFGTADDLHQTVATGALGRWFFGLIPNGTFRITLPASGSAGLPASETLVFNAFGNLTTLPAQASATAGGNAVTGMNFAYELPDTAPTLGNWASGVQTIRPSESVYLTTTFAPTGGDVELDKLVSSGRGYSYEGVVLTVQRYDGFGHATPNVADAFGGDAQLAFSGNNVLLNGAAIGTFIQVGGTLSITLGAGTGKSTVSGLLSHLTYSNATTGTVIPSITIGATVSDANFNNVPLATGFTGRQGTGGVMTSAPVYSVFALAPGGQYQVTFIEPNNTPAAASAVALGTGRLDLSGGQLQQVVVALTTGFTAGEDFLTFTNDGTSMGNIAGSYDAATGRLVLTSAGATATAQQWQNAAGAILYYNASDRPTTATRDVSYTFTTTTGPAPVGGVLGHIVVAASDDSPIIDPSVAVSLAGATEDGLNLPSGAVGTLVTTLANATNVADTDGANAHDGSAPGPTGIAIVGADTTRGNWWYSLDNGASWALFAGPSLPAMSGSRALHLVADGNTRIYFQPTVPNFNGALPIALSYRAWDRSDGVANGTLSALPTDVPLGSGTLTDAAAYSSAVAQIPQAVAAVNDAPVATGTANLVEPEDTTSPAPATVASLFGANFSDAADQQQSPSNPTGSVANALAGIAITGNATVPGSGTWRYSLDGGASWTAVAGGLSDSNALVLSASARLEFLPAANFNGVPSLLTVRLIDSSDVIVTGTTTGAALAVTTQAIGGVDVTANGGTTAVSAARVPLSVVVTAVNDAPVASGATSLPANPEDTTSPNQTTVLNLFGANFSDVADQQRSLLNPTGSVANTLAGVAITGNLTPAGEGVWRYSTDGGATWVALPRDLSATNALVLSAAVRLEFLPAPDFNGAPLALTARLIDSSDVVVTGTTTGADLAATTQAIAGVDVSGANSGGTTAVSAGAVVLSTTVTPVNDAPTAAGDATLRASVVGLPPRSQSVVDLFAASFGDTVDLQRTVLNPTGSISDVLAGVVVVGNTTPASQGEWRYSQDGGATWTAISTGVSDTAGLALGGNVQLAFFAAPGFVGFPTPLSVRLIDSSHDVPVTGSLSGQDFTGTTLAVGGVDVSGAHNGGITAISADAVLLRTIVLPTGPYSLPFVEPNNTPAAGHAVFLPGATPSGPLDQVVLQLGGGFTAGEDVLRFANDGTTMGNIVAAYDAASGRLVLSSAGGTASPTEWSNALAAVNYVNTSDQPHTVARSVTYTFFSSGGGTTTLAAGELTVTAANDAPILDRTVEVSLANSTEDVVGPPQGAVGTLVTALANGSNVSDLDGANAHDGSAPGPTGIAVVEADTTRGNWWYSTDNGASWTRFAGPDLTAISAGNALHLVADANTRIYFQPTVADFNGALPIALSYRAWDRSDGVANGALSALPSTPPLSTGINTASSAYSIAMNRVGLVVVAVNDAPVASGTASLGVEPEDTTSPVQGTVLGLFRGNFSDVADQQQSPSNPFGSNANALAGIAIVGNATPTTQGVWRYSTDNGATWTTISADVSASNALVLSQLVRLEFVPTANFNGIPAPLTVRLIDSSIDVPLVSGVTGRDLVATSRVIAGVDVSGSNSGGRTAVSAADVPLLIQVSPVNDAPTAAGSATLESGTQGRTPPYASVYDLFAKTFGDTVDQQRSTSNPFGSVANSFAGIVVVGNATPASEGTWRYSTDGGATWTPVPTSVSDAKGLLLGSNVQLAFFPSGSFVGSPTPLVVRLIDSSSDVPVTGTLTGAAIAGSTLAIAGVDVDGTHRGGITAVSADTVPLNTFVNLAPSPPTPPTPPNPTPNPWTPPSSFFDDPRMLNGFLVGGNVYRVMLATQPGTINVSADIFYGSVSPRELSFEASSIGGGPLPPWLSFDSILLRFTGTPPESAVGTLDLRITARDRSGREAAAEVHVIITEPPRDILRFLRPIEGLNPIVVPPAEPVPAPAAAPDSAPAPRSPDGAPTAPPSNEGAPPDRPAPDGAAVPGETRQGAWLLPPAEESLAYGLTAQIREQSVAGKVARARALLNALM